MDASFFQAPVEVPKLSGFDKSFQNLYTCDVGTLVPALCDELMAGSVVDLDMAASVSLPPLASDTFMRCSLKVECFFVPMRLCFGGFEHFFVGDTFKTYNGSGTYADASVDKLPSFRFVDSSKGFAAKDLSGAFGAGTLTDYLGLKNTFDNVTLAASSANAASSTFSLMPYIAYHKCWSDWYRSSLVQHDCFTPRGGYQSAAGAANVACLPYDWYDDFSSFGSVALALNEDSFSAWGDFASSPFELADGTIIFQTRQRNFGFDFFTCATPTPAPADSIRVKLDPTSLTTLGNGFTISQLRSMNSLAQWKERNQLAGDRYVDRLYAQYGCRPSDGIAQRVLCLGSADIEVYNKGIYSNNNDGGSASQNPFGGTLGARGGSAYGSSNGSINLCHGFKAAEPGYLFVMTSLVPRVTYAMGVDSKLTRYTKPGSIGEMATPILQNIGPEPIFARELGGSFYLDSNVFGYTDRYGHFKNKFDELHGLVRMGESLESFAAQRYISAADAEINTSFLTIPKNYLDNVTAVKSSVSEYGVWVDSYFRYRVSMPLAKYSLPSLQDPAYEHGKTLVVRRGGFRF